jgi:hypothetical protein
VDLWVGEDAEFMAQSMKNRENRGKDGTHNAGNRSHDRYKAHQVILSDIHPSCWTCSCKLKMILRSIVLYSVIITMFLSGLAKTIELKCADSAQ